MRSGKGPSTVVVASIAALTAVACSSGTVVNTGDTPASPAVSTAPTRGPATNANLLNAYDYYAQTNGRAGYYFTTPSGKWRCAILPHVKAGCQSTTNSQSGMGIRGEPDTVANAIVVEREGDAHFALLDEPELSLVPGPAKALPFNKILAAAGFRCNVQDAGVSCLSELTGNGFTFSSDGYTLSYTDIAPPP